MALGLQKLRRGTQVRAMGVNAMPAAESSRLLMMLGY